MDIQLEKYKLLEWLIGLKDEVVISKIKDLKENTEGEWSKGVSDIEKLFVEAGLKDIDEGNTFSHDQILNEISKMYNL